MKKILFDKVTLRLGEVLDSWVVVGLGERNLLPGHVREWGHHVVRYVLVGPVDDSFEGSQKNNSLGGCIILRKSTWNTIKYTE